MRWMRSRPALVTTLLALPLFAACNDTPASPDLTIDPIHVDSLDVVVGTGVPVVVEAHVQGVVGDGCTVVHSVKQERSGSTVTITILRERPTEAICTQLARLYDARIPLEGAFSPGAFLVRANNAERAFTIP